MNTYLYNGEVVTASNKNEVLNPKKVVAIDMFHLKELISEAIDKYGNNCALNFIDVSRVTDMSEMFMDSNFNGDISKWNVSNVINMSYMFSDSKFNGDISKWNVSKVEDMEGMFNNSEFNGDISKWNVSKVKNMSWMFANSKFNGDISKWNVSKVENMSNMFNSSKFNGDISKWIPMMKKNGIDFDDLELKIKEDTWNDIEV